MHLTVRHLKAGDADNDQREADNLKCRDVLVKIQAPYDCNQCRADAGPYGIGNRQFNVFERCSKTAKRKSVKHKYSDRWPEDGKAIGKFHHYGAGNLQKYGCREYQPSDHKRRHLN